MLIRKNKTGFYSFFYENFFIGGNNSYLKSLNPFLLKKENGFEVTDNGINEGVKFKLKISSIYKKTEVQTSGSGSISDPYTLTPSSDINLVAYTLNGQSTTKTYAELLTTNVVKNVTCKNGTTAEWNYERNGVFLSEIKTPDYCTIDFTDGYIVTLTSSNGTVSPTSQAVGSGGSALFTVTPNSGFKAELETNTCGGTLSGNTYTISNITSNKTCSVTFKSNLPTLYAKILADKTRRPFRGSFSTVLTIESTKTLYTSTEEGTTVYYFAGNALDNWVKFGKNTNNQDLYWRIIRTNSDGGVRLLYHGTSTTATDAVINSSTAFNTTYNDPMYAGYMYGTSGSLVNNRTNTNNSTIKTVIDNWYKNNLITNYGKYLSTTAVYCNDRSDPEGGYNTGRTMFYYGASLRLETNKTPSYDCATTEDKFTVDSSTGNGKLTYPIALMTADEVSFAGGVWATNAPTWYYKNSVNGSSTGPTSWYLLSPEYWSGSGAAVLGVIGSDNPGRLMPQYVFYTFGVRPVISLKSCIKYSTGNGAPETPYEIVLDPDISC